MRGIVEPLELLLGGIGPGEHLRRMESEQPLQRFRLVDSAPRRPEYQTVTVQVARAVQADIERRRPLVLWP
jgi:hypothetical protein